MKKTLAAVAVLGAFAGSALAADVQLYGIVDTGFLYTHTDTDTDKAGADAVDKLEMMSGMASGSRFGFKGTEDLGNGLTVGFILENGISSDTGVDKGVFFDRESSLFLQGSFGKVAFGRIGSINNGTSSWGKYGMISAFGTSYTDYSAQAGNWAVGASLWDNMIAYQTPTFAGFTVYAQYGMGNQLTDKADATKKVGVENESSSDRYYALGATYANGPLNLYAAVDSINYASAGNGKGAEYGVDDSLTVTVGGNYDFEVAKLFAGAQYFDEVKLSSLKGVVGGFKAGDYNSSYVDETGTKSGFASKVKGWSLGLSASIPAGTGTVLVGAAYVDAEAADSQATQDDEFSRWIVSAGYDYPFSKRTDVYVAATYMQDSLKFTTAETLDQDPYAFGAMVGLRHKF